MSPIARRPHPRPVCFITPIVLLLAVVCFATGMTVAPPVPPAGYDPMAVSSTFTPKAVDLVVKDTARQRDIPLRIYLPQSQSEAPVVMFSHGLGGSRENNRYLGVHWAARGYVAVFSSIRAATNRSGRTPRRARVTKRCGARRVLRIYSCASRTLRRCSINSRRGTRAPATSSPAAST
jgi:hypothetical protein